MKTLIGRALVPLAEWILAEFKREVGPLKIAVGGPPHSGKTVLMGLLRGLLPRNKFIIIEAAPDGEGVTGWSFEAESELVKAVRRKGKFTDLWVEKARSAIHNSTAPLTLVDLGGMMLTDEGEFSPLGKHLTPANEAMLRECDYLIIIASPKYAQAVPNWVKGAGKLGVKPFAILESILEGADDELFRKGPPLRARITKLDRDKPPVGSSTAKALVQRLLDSVGGEAGHDGSERADVNFPVLALELGVDDWTSASIPVLLSTVLPRLENRPEVRLWGNCSSGLPYHVIACAPEMCGKRIRYYDPKVPGYVPLPEIEPRDKGNGQLEWQIYEHDNYTFVEFVIEGQVFDVFDLPTIVPPEVNLDKDIVLSGKGPWWLTGTILRAYAKAGVKRVATFAPRESRRAQKDGCTWAEANPGKAPAIVIFSQDCSRGEVVPFEL